MANFGESLRKERESRKISLDAVVGATKISVRHLQAVEQNNFDQLPGGIFNRGIVRNYARMLGLDEEEWVRRYIAANGGDSAAFREDDRNWTAFAENVGRSRGKDPQGADGMVRWAGVAVLVLFLGGLSWFVWDYVHHKGLLSNRGVQNQALAMRQ